MLGHAEGVLDLPFLVRPNDDGWTYSSSGRWVAASRDIGEHH